MKIQKQSKKVGQPHPEVATLISTLIVKPQNELAAFISSIHMWTWPRSDLNSWTKVLNRFDTIFSDIIDKYNIDKLQLTQFEEGDRTLLLELLRFERMLLENSTNRKLFASYDRLNALLATSDLDVLVAVLHLLLRPSQQYSSQPPTSHSLNISAPRLQALALRWPGLREAGLELHDLLDSSVAPPSVVAKAKSPEPSIRFGFGMSSSGFATPTQASAGTSTPLASSSQAPKDSIPGAGDVTFQFYRKSGSVAQVHESKSETSNVEHTPTRPSASSRSTASSNPMSPSKDTSSQSGRQSGMTVVRLTDLHNSGKDPMQIVGEAVLKYEVPDEEVFELMCRVRIAYVLAPGQESAREKVACARLLAIAIFAHTQSESAAQQQLFLYEPDLTQHLAELIHHDRNIPIPVQIAAVNALDGIARYRHRSTEVLAAVNANVSHGILMGALRKAVAESSKPSSKMPNEFPEALLGFITYLASQSAGGTQVVGAGLVQQLILLVENRLPERMTVVSKAMPLVDNLLYGFPTAFQLFINAHGVDAMVERILHEVTTGVEKYGGAVKASNQDLGGTASLLPFVHSSLLKHIIRSMHRMMQSSGTAEGLRTLIDSSLVKSIKIIMENKVLFGPPIYSIAINIMSMFVHNEPTSLAILQEAQVPDVFYGAVEAGIEPAIEVITSIPNAIGALCLNQAGQNQFNERKGVMSTFFSMFTSELHIKILLEKDNANAIGGAVDELVRHHPALKDVVFESIAGTLQKIEDLGNAFPIPKDQEHLYRLVGPASSQASVASVQDPAPSTSSWLGLDSGSAAPSGAVTPAIPEAEEQDSAKAERGDNAIASYIDILCRFLDGMFQHVPHCHEFVQNTDGLDRLGRLYALPCLPLGYGASLAADSMVQLLRSMTEVSATQTLNSLTKHVRQSLEETKAFWQEPSDKSRLAQLMDRAVNGNLEEANLEYRRLFTLHLRVNLLADIYTTVGYAHSRGGPPLIETLTGPDSGDILPNLGAFHRAFVWENAALKYALNAQGVQTSSNPTATSDELISLNRPQDGSPYHDNDAPHVSTSEKGDDRSLKVINEQNGHLMRHLVDMLPSALAPFFHAVVKVLAPSRRIADPDQRKQGFSAALVVANILKEHLGWRASSDVHATYAYATVMLNLLQILIFDERQSSAMQTIFLVAFFHVDGQERVVELLNNCFNAADRIFEIPEAKQTLEEKSELVYVLGCTKVALSLLQSLVSSSPLFESPQTAQLTTHDKPPTDEDYFEPHQFLIKCRVTFIPLASRLWNSSWLTKTPSELIRGVVTTVLEIMKGDREEVATDAPVNPIDFLRTRPFMQVPASRTIPADETRIQLLVDMGFSREAATRALAIGNNNTARATEYLLLHGPSAEGEGDGEGEDDDEGEGSSNEPAAVAPEASSSMQTDETVPAAADNAAEPAVQESSGDKGKEKAHDEVVVRDWVKELQDARQALRPDIGPRLLALADKDPQLVFDVKSAFVGSPNSYQASCLDALVHDLQGLTPSDSSFATRCRLLAIVLNDASTNDYVPPLDNVRALVDHLLTFSVKSLEAPVEWLAVYLLVIEVLLVIADEITPVAVPKDEEPVPDVALRPVDVLSNSRSAAFNLCLELLPLSILSNDDILAVFRLLILLTRDHAIAADFLSRGGLQHLLAVFNDTSKEVSGSQVHSLIILRHIVESPAVMKQIMTNEVKKAFPNSRNRPTEVLTFVNTCRAAALRDPEEFIEIAKGLCELTTTPRPGSGQHFIALTSTPSSPADQDRATTSTEASSGAKQVGNDFGERLIQYLVNELHRAGRAALDSLAEDASPSTPKASQAELPMAVDERRSATPTPNAETVHSAEPATSAPVSDYLYACFLLHTLAELLLSYPSCKLAFVAAGKKKMSTPVREGGKSKSTILSFLLSDLLSFGKIYGQPTEKSKRRATMSKCAMEVVVALCSSPSSSSQAPNDLKDLPSDIVNIRKTVLDVLAKSIKDTSNIYPIDLRYGRLISHAELCSLLLTPQPTISAKPTQDDVTIHLAKIMLEKNFVGILTTVVGELDLNYPNVKSLVSAILRPLEYLSKVAIKMGRSEKSKNSLAVDEGSETSSSMSVDEEEEESEVEAANDLYRNSALGMFSGEMDEPHYAQDEEMDDSEEEGEEVEMEFGDEGTGTDASDETSEDEDEIDAEGGIAIADAEEWEDEDEEMTDADDDEESDEDSEDDAGLTWDDDAVPEPLGEPGPDGELEREIDDMAAVDLQAALEGEDNGAEPTSDDEDNALEQVDALPVGDEDLALDWEGQQGLHVHNGRGFFMATEDGHRNRLLVDDGDFVFGRARGGIPGASNLGVASHPLLENPEAARGGQQSSSRSRRSARGGPPAVRGAFNEMLQVIDNMIGGEGAQLMQQLLAQHPVPPGSTLDITTNTTAGGAAIMASLHPQPSGRQSSSRHDRHAQEPREVPDFLPLPTITRWQDEISITHHRFSTERLRQITNHLIIALLPALREKLHQEKEAERERAEKAEREREEAERIAKEKEEAEKVAKPPTPEPVPVETPAEPTPDPAPVEPAVTESSEPQVEADVVMEDSPVPEPQSAEPAPEPSSAPQMDVDPQASGSGSGAAIDLEAPVVPPPEAPRVIVHIHGNEVDITDTGIDPTFLEALPDDMREEVLNQHVREQRTAASTQPRMEETQISADFLDALPPDIRAEILLQESAEQARLERARARAAEPAAPVGPSDIDPASFLASLDPQLRQAVLMEQEEGFLQTLPSAMIAEASAFRDTFSGRRYMASMPRGGGTGARHEQPPAPRKATAPRDSIQLLDKNGISSLVRLLFFPQFPRKNNLHKILINLCENSKTREDMFVLLISILQDGTADVAAVDQSFSQMSVAMKAATSPTKSITKSSVASQELNPLFAHLNGENIPNLVAQRCLDTLGLIVAANERSSLYFLTEHEIPAGMKRMSSRKGKGKEKHAPQTHFPVVLLLSLLDRPNILNSPAMLDSIASLLASISKPLVSLKAPAPTEPAAPAAPVAATTTPAPAAESSSTAAPAETPAAAPSTEDKPPVPEAAPKEPTSDETPESILRAHPPQIPHHNFRLIVNILTSGEVSGKTFTHTLSHIQHCSALPGARDVIASELKSKAQEFGTMLYNDLDDLARALEEAEASKDVRGPAIAKFSSASSDQAKLLRILKTIDYMYTSKDGPDGEATTDEEKVTAIYEDFRFQGLWRRLGDCLAVVEQKPDLEHIATVLLPLIEALMVVCKHVKQSGGRAQRALMSPLSPSTPRVSMGDLFVEFTDAHRKVLNLMVRNNPSLMGGSFSLLVQNPRVLDFDNKRNWFNQQLRRRSRDVPHGTLQLNLRRPHVFEDSFQNLQRKTGDQIKYGKLSVRFYNEEGVDAGGVTREWFQILARQMFNPDYALFQPCAADKLTFQPNRASMVNPEHLSFFKFVGRVIGKAIYDGRLMDAHFARSMYRQILGKPVDYRDVEWVDPDYYKSLCWILENDPTMLEMTFTVEADEFGVHKVVPLKENGEKIIVDQENKKEFVQLSAQYRLFTSIKEQIESLLEGFYDIIPRELISIFNEQEVELLISGTPDIDIDEWRAATDYNGYSPSDPAIVWWWRALKSFDREDRAKVLSFATGTSRVPLDGFGDLQGVQGTQRFSIHRAYGDSDRLPQAHTCFNQIDLPQYSSYEKMRTQLLLAINEGGEGFGFA